MKEDLHGLDVALVGLDIAIQGLQELAQHEPLHLEDVQGLLWSCRVGRDLLDDGADTSRLLKPENWPPDWRQRVLAAVDCNGPAGARFGLVKLFAAAAAKREGRTRHVG